MRNKDFLQWMGDIGNSSQGSLKTKEAGYLNIQVEEAWDIT